MKKIEDRTFYLAGPITGKSNHEWREEYGEKLSSAGYGSVDPLAGHYFHIPMIRQHIENRNWKHLEALYDKIAREDISKLAKCDAVILRWNLDCRTVGSISEAFYAWYFNKPVYLITEATRETIANYSWLNAFLTSIYKDIDEFLDRFDKCECEEPLPYEPCMNKYVEVYGKQELGEQADTRCQKCGKKI